MPKEVVHWTIAELARREEKTGRLFEIINNYYCEYLIGAVAFDIPYHDFLSCETMKTAEIGKRLHGIDLEKAYTNYNKLFEFFENIPDSLWAFVAGTFCHALTDIVFHPFIIYISKNSVEEHRRIETMLDLFYIDRVKIYGNASFKKMLKDIKTDRKAFIEFISLFIFGEAKNYIAKTSTLLCKYKIFQSMIKKKYWYSIMKFLNFVLGGRISSILALFYGDFKKKRFEIFEKPLPCLKNGKVSEVGLVDIEKMAISEILRHFQMMEDLIRNCDTENIIDFFKKFYFPPLTGE